MQRRTAIKSISVIAAGMALFPACSDGLTMHLQKDVIPNFSQKQSIWIEAISEAILPKGEQSLTTFEDFPSFVHKMIAFNESPTNQMSFFNGYNLCTEDIKSLLSKDATEVTAAEIVTYFTDILDHQKEAESALSEEQLKINKDKHTFCQSLRSLAIKHLTTSKEYQESVLEYKLVPAAFQSCVKV